MAWGARQHEDGSWRLCERKGRTILFLCTKDAPGVEIRFSGRAAAQKCAEELNEGYWVAYRKFAKNGPPDNPSFATAIIEIIEKHGGIQEKK